VSSGARGNRTPQTVGRKRAGTLSHGNGSIRRKTESGQVGGVPSEGYLDRGGLPILRKTKGGQDFSSTHGRIGENWVHATEFSSLGEHKS